MQRIIYKVINRGGEITINSELQNIQQVVQEVAEAIASALVMEVEIFDNNLVVVGATGRIRSKIGFKQETAHVATFVLERGSSCTIDVPGEHFLCAHCKIKKNCFCTSALVCPISRDGKIIGTISLLSFDEEQRRILLSRQGQFLDYMARMGELIAGQAQLNMALTQIASSERHLKTIIDSVSEGIIAVDSNASISYFNKAAERLLNTRGELLIGKPVQQFFPNSPLPSIINEQTSISGKEISYKNEHIEIRLAYSAYPIILGDKVVGAVKTFNDIKTITKYAGSLASRHEAVTFDDIHGSSPVLKNLIKQAKVVAKGRSTVLLQGESGTGKELFARAIHQDSPFKTGPFQAINCSAIPELLLESELFGYEEGAFTGARKGGKPGKFELADGGTLFLDEIGDMPLFLQAKLLRVLESSNLERVGGTKEYWFNVRLIAATNQDLEMMLNQGKFRYDLYYRLNVIPLYIPSLKERRDDVIFLASHFLEKYCFLLGKQINSLHDDVAEMLLNYNWPGNVRELENVIEYAVNFEQSVQLTKQSLPKWLSKKQHHANQPARLKNQTSEWEYEVIEKMIEDYGASLEAKKIIADKLGISVTTLYRKLKKMQEQSENVLVK
ncbi:MAG: sigma 54-interacting transcriptional regulator [Firmicutes bacterium]|nr:sigma 54-interacting transcriptional regulator [Bacillota bacterium]